MRIVVVGAGPAGLFTAIALARRGRDVTIVDRDPGPPRHGAWRRRGVMQFHHAHSFRGQVVEALNAEMPDAVDALTASGAVVVARAGRPATLQCRRALFETALRHHARREARLRWVFGHADDVVTRRGRVCAVRVDGSSIDADVVIDASGRAGGFLRPLLGRGEGADCGATYVGRQYTLRDGADPGPTNSVIGLSLSFPDYGAVVFQHDRGTFTVTLIHSGGDGRWHRLRHGQVFDAAVGAIPALADWVHPDRAVPIAPVLPGGRLHNRYRGQLDDSGRPVLPGLVSVGDAVCTTTPLAGRGVALAFLQARELIRLFDERLDIDDVTTHFDAWCTDRIKPWFADHLYTDAERVRRWSGRPLDLRRRLPSDLVVAAAEADPRLDAVVAPYVTMDALPESLLPAQPRAREIYAGGWRPTHPPGPTGEALMSAVSRTPAVA